MGELNFYELKCRRCGGQLTPLDGGIYVCESCGKKYEKQSADIADQLSNILDGQKQEAIANLRQQLWQEMNAKYINSKKIIDLARDLKKFLPDDYFANFCDVANSGSNKEVNDFLNNTSKENMADYADIVLDFMLKSIKSANISAVSLFIERAFKGDTDNYDKYTTVLENEAEKINEGIYLTSLTRDVFLAYSSADIAKVLDICDYLESNKISCFLALRNLRHGRGAVDNYDNELRTAIDNCRTVVFVSSTHSRDMDCDAVKKELPYIKQRDIEAAPAEYKRDYSRMPAEYMMPRVEYLIEEYTGNKNVAERYTKEFFHSLEWCKSKEAVADRITKYLTESHETTAQRAEREKREFQQKLEEEHRLAEEQRAKAREYELRIAEAERARVEAEQRAKSTTTDKTEIKEDPNARYCKKCRTANKPGAKFCAKCGSRELFASFDEYLESKIKYCAQCGAKNDIDDKFCVECGSSEFKPTKREYEVLEAKREAERKKKEEELRRIKEEEHRRYIEENFDIQKSMLVKYKGSSSDVHIPETVTLIGNESFSGCYWVKNVTMDDSVVAIGSNVFSGCYALKQVVLSENLTVIEKYAFKLCNSLPQLVIPKSVKKIGIGAFEDCPDLKLIFEDKQFGENYLAEESRRIQLEKDEKQRLEEQERLRIAEEDRMRHEREEQIRIEEENRKAREEKVQRSLTCVSGLIEAGEKKEAEDMINKIEAEAIEKNGVNDVGGTYYYRLYLEYNISTESELSEYLFKNDIDIKKNKNYIMARKFADDDIANKLDNIEKDIEAKATAIRRAEANAKNKIINNLKNALIIFAVLAGLGIISLLIWANVCIDSTWPGLLTLFVVFWGVTIPLIVYFSLDDEETGSGCLVILDIPCIIAFIPLICIKSVAIWGGAIILACTVVNLVHLIISLVNCIQEYGDWAVFGVTVFFLVILFILLTVAIVVLNGYGWERYF